MSNKRNNIVKDLSLPGLESNEKYQPAVIVEPGKDGRKKHTAIAIHTVKQFFADPKQLSLFSEERIDDFIQATGLPVANRPDAYGVILNQAESRVFEGILKAFSDTNYQGDLQREKRDELRERGINLTSQIAVETIKKIYSNIEKIPVIKITQAELLSLSGYDTQAQKQGDKQDVVGAIKTLSTTQFCFYWVRLKKDSNGKPVKDNNGEYVKEDVMEVGTLFNVRYVKKEGEDKLDYYEVSPSPVIIDQVNNKYGGNYFLLIPEGWRDEVKQLTGKRASRYTYEFLEWLRLQYELKRRQKVNYKKNFTINKSWEEVAVALKMPESMYRANRKRAITIINEAYSTAIKLGYLLRVENSGATDILYLNESYYPKPRELV